MNRLKRFGMWGVLLGGLLLGSLRATPAEPPVATPMGLTVRQESLTVGTHVVSYWLAMPTVIKPGEKLPMVVMFHGLRRSAKQTMDDIGFNALAARSRFIVVYPQARQGGWDVYSDAQDRNPVDVNAVRLLLDHLTATAPADSRRIYATGFSNGGFFTQRLACEMSDRFAAVAPVSATMGLPLLTNCPLKHPMPILMINGTADRVVTANGHGRKNGIPIIGDIRVASRERTLEFWRTTNQCPATSFVTPIPDTDHGDHMTSLQRTFSPCAGDSEVSQVLVDGGGHTWPGGPDADFLIRLFVGHTTHDFSAAPLIWDFVRVFTLKVPG